MIDWSAVDVQKEDLSQTRINGIVRYQLELDLLLTPGLFCQNLKNENTVKHMKKDANKL